MPSPPRLLSSALCSRFSWVALCVAFSGCAAPITVQRLSLTDSYKERSQSTLSGQTLSNTTRIVLERQNLLPKWKKNPAQALAILRASTQAQFYTPDLQDQLFALAELHYLMARQNTDRTAFMAAALYAYAYLNPDGPEHAKPNPYDVHFRQACDIYMFGLTEALGNPVNVTPQRWTLPFGTLDLSTDPAQTQWYGYTLTDFRPTARLSVRGIKNIYRKAGLGEPLAAVPRPPANSQISFSITDKLRIPVNLLLDIPTPRQQIFTNQISGRLTLATIDRTSSLPTTDGVIPLQYDQTASRAISLSNAVDWSVEYKGFLDGNLFNKRAQLIAIEPHQYGHRPVVLVHGTASSPGRWADMVNDLLEDPQIREHYEFWFFSYATGNPIPYSALQLRDALNRTIHDLGGTQADPALGQITLIGHSQGGLLAKMLAIDPHDALWKGLTQRSLSSLNLSANVHQFLERSLFPTPMPEVKSVVFISTPQHGSYLADFSIAHLIGRMVTFPAAITEVTQQILQGNTGALKVDMSPGRLGSVYGMSPRSAFIQALASVPVAPDVQSHSIIPVIGNGPLSHADDGVVTYASAHDPQVQSELVVRNSGHSTQANPITIAEVRRILLQQLATTLPDIRMKGDMNHTNIMRIGGDYVIPAAWAKPQP
ncbi:alpha/beta fold hydrolase [Acetobacter sp. LMG 32666]|uniref:esterase/lipase family protein n=1 Tax=Acetobacter sp. LMG 32666 TaxID=2959295 RepID=UPI0030C8BEC4